MKITFCGAAREVTGSNFLVEAAGKKFLVDCGLIQGRMSDAERNYDDFIYDPAEIDFVLLTHAHIDHSGRIPKLVKEGFTGDILATKATIELSEIMLLDSAHIQESEIEWKNKKRIKKGEEPLDPLYVQQDAEYSFKYFKQVDYMDIIELDENIRVRFNEAGHMLGSAIIEVWVTEGGKTTKTVFTGDLGNNISTLLEPAMPIAATDYLVMESTYGSRNHVGQEDNETKARKFLDIVATTLRRGGNVVIPSFAVGRTQEILYEINKIKERLENDDNKDKQFLDDIELVNNTKVFVDSPLATNATEVFANNTDLFDAETRERIEGGDNPFDFKDLIFTRTAEESKEIKYVEEPVIIISASGMCDAGRVKHHLVDNLWDPKNTILFVGYQATNTLGRRIIDGAKKVKIFGDEIAVNAQIEYIEGYSGHADQEWLLNFVHSFREKPKAIFLVHGEEESEKVLKQKIEETTDGIEVYMPYYGDEYEVGEIVTQVAELEKKGSERMRKKRLVFADRLNELSADVNIMSGELENSIIGEKEGFKDIANEDQINMLYDLADKLDEFKIEILNLIENVKLGTGNSDEKIAGDISKRQYPLIVGKEDIGHLKYIGKKDEKGNIVLDNDRNNSNIAGSSNISNNNNNNTYIGKKEERNQEKDVVNNTEAELKQEIAELEKEIANLENSLKNEKENSNDNNEDNDN